MTAYWDAVMVINPCEMTVTKDVIEMTETLREHHKKVLEIYPLDPRPQFGEVEQKTKENQRCLAPFASWCRIWGWKVGNGVGEYVPGDVPGIHGALYASWSKLRIELSESEKKRYNARLDLLRWGDQNKVGKVLAGFKR